MSRNNSAKEGTTEDIIGNQREQLINDNIESYYSLTIHKSP